MLHGQSLACSASSLSFQVGKLPDEPPPVMIPMMVAVRTTPSSEQDPYGDDPSGQLRRWFLQRHENHSLPFDYLNLSLSPLSATASSCNLEYLSPVFQSPFYTCSLWAIPMLAGPRLSGRFLPLEWNGNRCLWCRCRHIRCLARPAVVLLLLVQDCLYMRYGEHVLEALENPNCCT